MSLMPNDGRMKPIIIIPLDTMSDADIKELRDNGLCVVTAKEPGAVKFLDPIPSAAERTKVEDAAIELSRKVLKPGFWTSDSTRQNVASWLVKGTRLDPSPKAERLEAVFDEAKEAELRRLAREEAKEERRLAREKAAKEKGKEKAKDA